MERPLLYFGHPPSQIFYVSVPFDEMDHNVLPDQSYGNAYIND